MSPPLAPLSTAPIGTVVSNVDFQLKYAAYWGHGWYVLPNPMHGSWTTAH